MGLERDRLCVLHGRGSWAVPVAALNPAKFRIEGGALAMRLAGWSFTRIARAFGVQRPAVVKWFQRRDRPEGVERRRPAWIWRSCSTCRAWGWFRQTHYRRELGKRVFCSASCYRARGGKAKRKGEARAVAHVDR